jgi:hypothetical protein
VAGDFGGQHRRRPIAGRVGDTFGDHPGAVAGGEVVLDPGRRRCGCRARAGVLRAGPPASPATVLNASRFPPLVRAPSRRQHPCQQPYRGLPSHVPRSSGRSDSRRLYAGHRRASKRVTAQLVLGPYPRPSFDAI